MADVPRNRFEYEDAGQTAYLEWDEGGGWMTLWHTEIPEALRGRGIAAELARSAFEYARSRNLKVDVICPSVAAFVKKNPEYELLVGNR